MFLLFSYELFFVYSQKSYFIHLISRPKIQMLCKCREFMYMIILVFLASILVINTAYGFDRSTNVQNPERCYDTTYPINWSGCHLYGKVLPDVDYTNANLSYANLAGAILSGKDLSNANLKGAFLKYAEIDNANLTNANLSEVAFVRGWMRNSDLSYANLSGGYFVYTEMTSSNFTNANFQYATLTNTVLASTDLKNANLEGAGTWKTNLNNCINHPICDRIRR